MPHRGNAKIITDEHLDFLLNPTFASKKPAQPSPPTSATLNCKTIDLLKSQVIKSNRTSRTEPRALASFS
jgi:hypothetical protein